MIEQNQLFLNGLILKLIIMAKIYYVGDWAVLLGPSFAETPFQHAPKGLEIFNYGKWLKDALESDFNGMTPILGYNETKTIPDYQSQKNKF